MIIPLGDRIPHVDASAFVAPTAQLVGDVELQAGSSVWYTAVLRAEFEPIVLGERSNLQDGVVVHTDTGKPARVGSGVSVGHRAVLHGCTIEDDCLIGMGSVILNGAVIGEGSLVAAGAVLQEGVVIPPRSLVAGVPGKVRRVLIDEQVEKIRHNAEVYVDLARLHGEATSRR
ncbi:MAG: gamma carbonic anhydrase family protein [Intrasporangium sp.]|uniref:gamma carbonic anhydrase family protein n=1 Tax=Intrasporangium sp. TaxID=1925024 RepID=UPI002648B669|nr:gamma carbonic anhydrase family protein [Intrasporangium sp.]MDN5798151.1 gamma carbonic anhydrase family protein [Intrasporangium sp.]